MRISKQNINKNLEKEIFELFFQLIADLKTAEEARLVLEDVLEKTELSVLAKRLAVAYYLEKGRSYQNIKDNLCVSSATIASIDKKSKSPGYQIALKKIEAEQWASQWADKINGLFNKK